MKCKASAVLAVMFALVACQLPNTSVGPAEEPQVPEHLDAIIPKPRAFTLPATVIPQSDSLPNFGIEISALSEREAAVVKSAWHNYQRVLAGKEPGCSVTYGLSDGGSTMHDCGSYELMRVRGLSGTADRWGYEYGPSLNFLNGHKVERLRFMTDEELRRLEAAP